MVARAICSCLKVYNCGVMFMNKVKHILKNKEGKYYKLFVLMRDYYNKRISSSIDINMNGCISRVKNILAGHRELLLELKVFYLSKVVNLMLPPQNAYLVLRAVLSYPSKVKLLTLIIEDVLNLMRRLLQVVKQRLCLCFE